MRLPASLLVGSLLLTTLVPTASAAPCNGITQTGVVPWTLCMAGRTVDTAEAFTCLAWALVWGPADPCPWPDDS